jgi:hypothetical protein
MPELMHGNIGFTEKDCDLYGTHRKAVMYDDVRRILNERGAVDIYLGDNDVAVLSLWKVKGAGFNAPHTHVAILSSEPHDELNWYIVEEQQFYLYDEEKAVIAFVGRLHQDDWREFEKTGSLFVETTCNGKTEAQWTADKAAQVVRDAESETRMVTKLQQEGNWPFKRVEA